LFLVGAGPLESHMSKKVDVSFMRMVNTEDDWKREIKECGPKLLCIIDVYSSLWGPCEMLAGHFSNFFFDLGETCGIKFVRACADGIDSLKEHRQSSSPVFLIYLDGELKKEIKGADIPQVKGCIMSMAPKIEG